MATRNYGLATDGKEIDLIDVGSLVFVPWLAGLIFGFFSFGFEVFGGYDLVDPIWTVGGADISAALILLVLGIGWIVGTNELDGSDYAVEEYAMIAIAFIAPLAYVFIPAFQSLVHWSDVMPVFFTVLVSVAAVWISYVE